MTEPRIDDPYLPLAFAIHSTPRAYAVLAGAGISRGAGVPTAWEVVTRLAQKVCTARGGDPDTIDETSVDQWWRNEFGNELTYSSVLEKLGSTPRDRERLLREFFDTGTTPTTSDAHRAIARLVKAGFIRVIVTLNFDHLFETALRDEGVVPTVVSTPTAAAALAPIHTLDCLIVHLHGDYTDASSMKNTVDELSDYQPAMHILLDQILHQHALLAIGWSVTHDHALREIVTAGISRHHASAWIDPYPSTEARELAQLLDAHTLEATADDALTRIADIVTTLDRPANRHPLTAAVAARRIKDDLAGNRPAITAHDTFMTEYTRAAAIVESHATREPASVSDATREVIDGAHVLCAATAVLAYWGTADTDRWWTTAILDHAQRWRGSGSLAWLELPITLAGRLFYAAGVAATAAGRYDILGTLLSPTIQQPLQDTATNLGRLVNWRRGLAGVDSATAAQMREQMEETLRVTLGLPARRISDAWEDFEVLRLAHQICTHDEAWSRLANAASDVNSVDVLLAQARRRGFQINREQHRNEIDVAEHTLSTNGLGADVSGAHVLVRESESPITGRSVYVSEAVSRIRRSAKPAIVEWMPNDHRTVFNAEVVLRALETRMTETMHSSAQWHQSVWLDQLGETSST